MYSSFSKYLTFSLIEPRSCKGEVVRTENLGLEAYSTRFIALFVFVLCFFGLPWEFLWRYSLSDDSREQMSLYSRRQHTLISGLCKSHYATSS